MSAPQNPEEELLAAGGPAAAIIRRKDHIVGQFQERVRARLPSAAHESPPIIIDTLPAFLTRLALALSPDSGLDIATAYSNIALQHGNERAKLTGYSLIEVIREYQVMREVLVEVLLEEREKLTPAHWHTVHRSLDEAMAQSAAAFAAVHTRFRDLFTAALSHDFRGPLQTALNFLELIRRDADPPQRTYFAAQATRSLKRIDSMIGSLLDVTRANSGARLSLRLEACDAVKIVRDVIDEVALRGGDRFQLDAPEPVLGHWDCARLGQAVENLLTNAVKYGRPGSPISTRVRDDHDRLVISVHNFGDPIPEYELAHLFQPFRRSLAVEQSGKSGWGLGLVLVQAVSEAHGGTASVVSDPESGTTFIIDVLRDVRNWRPPVGAAPLA